MDVNHAAPSVAFGGSGLAIATPSFDEVYQQHFDFIWRSARRLGVETTAVDDVVQEVFMVVHRKLADTHFDATVKSWLYGITVRIVRNHLRSVRRRGPSEELPESLIAPGSSPSEAMLRNQAARVLHAFLDSLDTERREVFVMVDLEQESVAATATALGINTNTAHGRLRAARQELENFLARRSAAESRRSL
ncbi:MAG: sigma-70 family RNA polymerase sigma factor [Sandaracinaceae bacterium]|nr:sigma-70 family RNA polymerase sigma factor [Sandaracinaceae bacterium]